MSLYQINLFKNIFNISKTDLFYINNKNGVFGHNMANFVETGKAPENTLDRIVYYQEPQQLINSLSFVSTLSYVKDTNTEIPEKTSDFSYCSDRFKKNRLDW